MAMVSKYINTLTKDDYLNIYSSLNHPTLIPHYKADGCLILRRDGKLIQYRSELEEYQREEKQRPYVKHYYELEFKPFDMFKLVRTKEGIKHFSNNEM